MATQLSQLGIEIDKVDTSDIPTGGTDKVLLYASGSGSDTKLYVKSGANTQKQLGVDIDQYDELTAAPHATQDEFLVSDNGDEKRVSMTNLALGVFAVASDSGDVSYGSDGELTIAATSVTNAMLAGSIADSKLSAISSANKVEASALELCSNTAMEDDAGLALKANIAGDGLAIAESGGNQILSVGVDDSSLEIDSDALRVKASGVTNAMLAGSIANGKLANSTISGVSLGSNLNALAVDDSSIEYSAGSAFNGSAASTIRVKASGVTNAMLAGSIANNKLANDSVTVGSTEIDLGASSTVLAGITQLTASNIQVTNLDVVTLNSVSQTETTLEIADKLIVAALSASSANSDGGGLKIGGGQNSAGNASILYDHANSALDFNIGGTTEMRLADGVLRPETDNDVDLGASGAEFKDLYLDGVAYIDDLRPDLLKMPDVTSGKLLVADGTSYEEVALSGDATLASSGALTIANDAVVTAKIADLNVTTGKLAADAVTAAKLADDAVVTASIVDANVTTAKLAADAVTAAKLADDAVVTANIVDANVTTAKLAADAVTSAKLADDSVNSEHIALGALDSEHYASGSIESNHLKGSVANAKLANSTISGVSLGSNLNALAVDDSSIEYSAGSAFNGSAASTIRVKASGVTNAMLAGSIANAKLSNSSVTVGGSAVALGGTVTGAMIGAALNADLGGSVQFGTQSDDVVAFGGPVKVGGNAIADSGGDAAMTFDGSKNISFKGAITGGSGYASGDFAITSNGSGSFAGDLIVGRNGTNAGGDVTFYGDATGEKVFFSGENNILQITGSAASGLQLSLGGNASSEYAVDVANGSSNSNKMRAAAFVTYSDESLKSDVATMNTALDTVMSLNGVEFTWKDSGERDFGFIAQDVQSVLPKAVHVADDGVQGVDYSRLTSVLVEAVKAQQVQIEELKALLKK